MSRRRTARGFILIAPPLMLMAAAPFSCPVGGKKYTDSWFYEIGKGSDSSALGIVFDRVYNRVAPDQSFIVNVSVLPIDEGIICANQPDACDDTVQVWLEMTCTGVTESFPVNLQMQGTKAVGTFSMIPNQQCVSQSGQRNAVQWKVLLYRAPSEAMRFELTVEYIDFDTFLL